MAFIVGEWPNSSASRVQPLLYLRYDDAVKGAYELLQRLVESQTQWKFKLDFKPESIVIEDPDDWDDVSEPVMLKYYLGENYVFLRVAIYRILFGRI